MKQQACLLQTQIKIFSNGNLLQIKISSRHHFQFLWLLQETEYGLTSNVYHLLSEDSHESQALFLIIIKEPSHKIWRLLHYRSQLIG